MDPTVVILTYCDHPASAYGALMVFDTLRVGYPDNRVIVIDNGSHPEVLPKIKASATAAGCTFIEQPRFDFVHHFAWWLLEQDDARSLVLLDPDVVFWKKMDLPASPGLMSGRLIPQFKRNGVVSLPRLHPSHLYIQDVQALREAVAKIPTWGFNPIGQVSAAIDGTLFSWDTCAPLYQAFSSECVTFNNKQLDCYDHLFYGSHLHKLKSLPPDSVPIAAHAAAKTGNVEALRGIWRDQDEFFTRMAA